MEKLSISALERDLNIEKAKKIRNSGYVPGVVYGPKSKNRLIKVQEKEFKNVFKKAGENTLIDLKVGKEEVGKIIISDYQSDPITGDVVHFDLYQVRMDKKVYAKIPIKFYGESPAVKNEGGILFRAHDKLEIRCLPADLIHEIKIDLNELENLEDIIRIKDLKIPEKVEIIAEPEDVVASVTPPRTEKELEELESKIEENVEAVEKAQEKEKKEEAEEGTESEEKAK